MRRGIETLRALLRTAPSTPTHAHPPRTILADPPALRGWRIVAPRPTRVEPGRAIRELARWAATGDGGWTRVGSERDRADRDRRRSETGANGGPIGRDARGVYRRREGDASSQGSYPSGPSKEHVRLNGDLAHARGVDALLAIVDARGDEMNAVNVATAVNSLWKQAKREARDIAREERRDPRQGHRRGETRFGESVWPVGLGTQDWEAARDRVGTKLSHDPRLPKLLRLVREKGDELHARAVSGVMHSLGVLHADLRALPVGRWTARFEKSFTAKLAGALSSRVEATAAEMNAQEVAIAYNACAKYDALGERLTPDAWLALALAASKQSSGFTPQGLAMTLNALSKTPAMEATAAAAVPQRGWEALARAVVSAFPAATWRPNDDGDMQSIAVIFNALAKLDHAALAIAGEDGWRVLVAAAVTCARTRTARNELGFNGQALAMVLNAFANCHAASSELATVEGGWSALRDNFVAAAPRDTRAQGACMILNASWKLIKEHGFETSAEFRRAAADFAARIAEDVPPKTTGLLVNSLAKLKDVAAEVTPEGWRRIAACVHRAYASVGDANFERDREKIRDLHRGDERGSFAERFADSGFEVGQFDGDELTATFQSVCACDPLVDALGDDTWRVISAAVADFARTGAMSPDSVFATTASYNALRKRAPRAFAAADACNVWEPLATCALSRLDDMNPIFVIQTLDAAKKLPELREALDKVGGSVSGWARLAERLGETAGELDAVNAVNAISALGWMPFLAVEMSDKGWNTVLDRLRTHETVLTDRRLSLEAAMSHGHDVSGAAASAAAETKYAEKSVSGLYLIQSHGGYDSYGKAVREKIAECIERIEGKMDDETRAKVHKRFEKLSR